MNAKKCDRCKRYYDFYGNPGIFIEGMPTMSNGVILASFKQYGGYLEDCYQEKKAYDLCPDCLQKVKEFLEGEK